MDNVVDCRWLFDNHYQIDNESLSKYEQIEYLNGKISSLRDLEEHCVERKLEESFRSCQSKINL